MPWFPEQAGSSCQNHSHSALSLGTQGTQRLSGFTFPPSSLQLCKQKAYFSYVLFSPRPPPRHNSSLSKEAYQCRVELISICCISYLLCRSRIKLIACIHQSKIQKVHLHIVSLKPVLVCSVGIYVCFCIEALLNQVSLVALYMERRAYFIVITCGFLTDSLLVH